jgi:CRP/FNR family cyclic AMP-dependent transcriptional regulator
MIMAMTHSLPPELRYYAGDTIIEQGEPAYEAYLIIDGEADVFFENEAGTTKVASLKGGDIFGESALFKGSDYGATVKAAAPLTVQPIPPHILDEKINACDPMIRALIRMMMIRLRKANDDIAK